MTQEEKELLLKDLCARLNYGVKIHIELNCTTPDDIVKLIGIDIENFIYTYSIGNLNVRTTIFNHLGELTFKPYLRPMSSMTEEERNEWMDITHAQEWLIIRNLDKAIDWLNAHHFDYRGLIEKGLALEALEKMYKF